MLDEPHRKPLMSERADGSVRRLAAIWFADIVGYTRLSSTDENTALLLVTVLQQLAREHVAAHGGRVVKFIGDAVLADFSSTDAALRSALALRDQFTVASAAAGAPSKLRIGIHVGDVLGTPDGDLYGDGVNLASRVQGAADPGQVWVTQDVWHQLRQRRDFRFESVGERRLKGLDAVWMFNAAMASADEPAPAPPPAVPTASVRFARIVRLVLVYGVAALVVLQVTGWLTNRFDLGWWVTPAGLVLLLVGFVVMVATGWSQTRSPWQRRVNEPTDPWKVDVGDLASSVKRKRFPTLTWGRALAGGALAFALLFGGAGAYVLIRDGGMPDFAPRSAEAQPGLGVAILPFQAAGADSTIWSEGMVDLLAWNLEGASGVRVVEPRAVLNRWRSTGQGGDSAAAVRLAQDVDARWAVSGRVEISGAQLTLAADVYDTETGQQVGTTTVSGPPEDLPRLLDELALQILQSGIASSVEAASSVGLSRLATPSMQALRAYLAGSREFRRSRWTEAQLHFRDAVEADSTFAQAQYGLSLSAGWATNPHSLRPDSHSEAAVDYAADLPERERMLVRGFRELVLGDSSSIGTLNDLTQRYPDDVEGWFLLGEAYFHQDSTDARFRNALNRARTLDPMFGPAYVHLMDDAIRNDLQEATKLVAAYRAVDPSSPLLMTLDVLLEQATATAAAVEATARAPAASSADPARAVYQSSQQAAEAARAEAPPSMVGQPAFARGDSLRRAALDEAAAGRYPAAIQRMEQARIAYERARADGLLAQQRDSLERAQNAAADRARADEPAPTGRVEGAATRPVQPASEPRGPSAEEIAAQVLGEIRSAIESETVSALRAVWTSLTAEQARNYQLTFDGTRDMKAEIETLSVDMSGDRVTLRIRTTLEFFNESTRRSNNSVSPEQTLQLEERNGRWVVVSHTP